MEGIITVKDTRANLNAIQQYRNGTAQEVISATGPEGVIDTVVDTTKTVVSVAGMVLNVATKFFPGHLDDIAVAVAQPAILNALEAGRGLLKGIFVSRDIDQIQASLGDLAGNVCDITIKDTNLVQTVQNKVTQKFVNTVSSNSSVGRKM